MKPEDETIEALSRSILRDAREEAEQIQTGGKEKGDEIRQKAMKAAEAEKQEILGRARQEAERIRSQVIASAQLKARTLQLEHREKLLERVFKAANERISGIQKRSDYQQIVMGLLREAVMQLSASKVSLRADAETQKILKGAVEAFSKEHNVEVSWQEPLEEGVGVVVDASDGHLHFDNTLETRLERQKNSLRSSVYQVLMGEKL